MDGRMNEKARSGVDRYALSFIGIPLQPTDILKVCATLLRPYVRARIVMDFMPTILMEK